MANSILQRGVMGLMDDGREETFETEQSLGSSGSSPIPDIIQKAFEDVPATILDPTIGAIETGFKDTKDALGDLFTDILGIKPGPEKKKNSNNMQIGNKSEIKFNQEQQAANQRFWYQKLEESRKDLLYSTQQEAIEEITRLEVGAMSTEEKNRMLGFNLSYSDKNITHPYHMHTLRVKKIEEIKAALEKKEEQSLAQTGSKSNLLLNMGAHEGQSAVSSSGAIFSAG